MAEKDPPESERILPPGFPISPLETTMVGRADAANVAPDADVRGLAASVLAKPGFEKDPDVLTGLAEIGGYLESQQLRFDGDAEPRQVRLNEIIPADVQLKLHDIALTVGKQPDIPPPELQDMWTRAGCNVMGDEHGGYFGLLHKGPKFADAKKSVSVVFYDLPIGALAKDHVHEAPPNTNLPGEVTMVFNPDGELRWNDTDHREHVHTKRKGVRISPPGSRDQYAIQRRRAIGAYVWFEGASFPTA